MQQQHYLLDTKRKKLLYSLGLLIAILYALFCGLSLAGYVVITFGTGGGALFAAAIGALVCCAANFKTSITKIPEILVDFFGRKRFFNGFFSAPEQTRAEKLHWRNQPAYRRGWHSFKRHRRKILLALGVVLSLIAGLAIFGQGYGGITTALMAFAGLTVATSAVTGIGIFGAVIFFLAFWAITLKAIILELQKQGWFGQVKRFFTDLFALGGSCRHQRPDIGEWRTLGFFGKLKRRTKPFARFCRHPSWRGVKAGWHSLMHTCDGNHKSRFRAIIEGCLVLTLLIAVLPLAILGVVTAMMASHMGIIKFVTDNWHGISAPALSVIEGASWFFVVGLASLGQLPFYLKTTMKTVKRLSQWGLYKLSRVLRFGKRQVAYEHHDSLSLADKLMYGVRLTNAGFSALYSYVGGGADHSLLADFGAAGGVLNSFSAPEKIGGSGFSDIWRNFKANSEEDPEEARQPAVSIPVNNPLLPDNNGLTPAAGWAAGSAAYAGSTLHALAGGPVSEPEANALTPLLGFSPATDAAPAPQQW